MSLIKNGFIINDENRNLGIIAITSKPNTKCYKVRISYKNTKYTHDLNNKGETEIFPLQMGNGKYTVTIYQ